MGFSNVAWVPYLFHYEPERAARYREMNPTASDRIRDSSPTDPTTLVAQGALTAQQGAPNSRVEWQISICIYATWIALPLANLF
jgi:hypothetical protein